MDTIGNQKVVCLNCKWSGIVDDCELDVDGDGSLGCPTCRYVVEELSKLINELLEYRDECEYEEAGEINTYNGEVNITNHYHIIDPDQYMKYKEQIRQEWNEEMNLAIKAFRSNE